MKYSELLSELRNNILRDSSSLVAGDAGNQDHLWSDATLMSYINQACNRFARRTLCLKDNYTPSITQVVLKQWQGEANGQVQGADQYKMDKKVLAVYSARFDLDSFDLGRIGHYQLNTYMPPDTLWFDINIAATLNPGRPQYFAMDEQFMTLRVYPSTDDANTGKRIYLRVARLPLKSATMDNLEDSPEFLEEYHLYLLEWAAYRALANHEVDGEDQARAKEHKQNFEDHIKEVIQEDRRRSMAPMNMQFGRLGFTWVR